MMFLSPKFLKELLHFKGESKSARMASGEPFATLTPTKVIILEDKRSTTELQRSCADKWDGQLEG